jgi:hypothetical protein
MSTFWQFQLSGGQISSTISHAPLDRPAATRLATHLLAPGRSTQVS